MTNTNRAATEFPPSIRDRGVAFYRTGKTGTNIATGAAVAEYEADDASRLWATSGGIVLTRND